MSDAEAIEAMPCPSCGRKTLSFWQDAGGSGGQCSAMDCLEMFEADELLEDTPND
jgi:Zn ribbon nucleic-acid-binding protein